MSETDEVDQLLDQLSAQPDETSRRAFLGQPEIAPQIGKLIERLAARVDFFNRSNPKQSLGLADLALLAAGVSSDPGLEGYAKRAKAHALRWGGRYQEALPLYAEASASFKQAGLRNEESRTYLGEISTLTMLGSYPEVLSRGEMVRRRLYRMGDKLNLAKLDQNLAIVNDLMGRYSQALRHQNRSMKLFETLDLTDLLFQARINRASVLWKMNRIREATQEYEASRNYLASIGMDHVVASIDSNVAFLLFKQGRYNEALNRLVAARDGFEASENYDQRADVEVDLGYCYSALGLINEAILSFEQASATFRELGMKHGLIRAEIGWAYALISKGELQAADALLRRILAIFDETAESVRDRHSVAVVQYYRAHLLTLLPQGNLEEALDLGRQAQATFRKLKSADWYAQSLLLEGDILRKSGRWPEAEQAYQAAAGPVRRLKLPHLLYQLHFGLGKLWHARSNPELTPEPGERKKLLEKARQEYLGAAEQVETIRAILRPEELRAAFMESGLSAYEALVELCLQDQDNPQRLEEAFIYVERSKSRNLLDLLSQDLPRAADPATAESSPELARLAERVQQLRNELNWYYSQVHNSQLTGPEDENQRVLNIDAEKVSQEVETREKELVNLLRRFRPILLPPYTADMTIGRSRELALELGQQLGPDRNLVEYYVLGNQVLAFVLSGSEMQVYTDLCSLERVQDLQERLNYQANKFNLGRSYVERRMDTLREAFDLYLRELYGLLIAPLKRRLRAKHLVIVPHGSLHTLPFHALFDGQRYLFEQFEISYAPSAGVLLHCLKQTDRRPEKLLALAVPDEQLTGVEAEVRGLAPLFKESRLLVGPDATLDGLQSNLNWCDVLHLASHGVFREDNPLFSLLKLSDGWLSVHDVMNWRFSPTLVTLSACQTGLNRPMRGDELLGLARGFFSAGAYSLVVSLWSVSDEVTTRLMQLFYEALNSGLSRSASLRQAMLQLRRDARYAHPHYWAPFVILGQP